MLHDLDDPRHPGGILPFHQGQDGIEVMVKALSSHSVITVFNTGRDGFEVEKFTQIEVSQVVFNLVL